MGLVREHEDALDSRLKQCRAVQAKLWDEADPEVFSARLEDLAECLEAVAAFFEGPHASGVGRKWRGLLQPLAYTARNAESRLRAKLEQPGVPHTWKSTYEGIAKLADLLEAKAAEAVPTPQSQSEDAEHKER